MTTLGYVKIIPQTIKTYYKFSQIMIIDEYFPAKNKPPRFGEW